MTSSSSTSINLMNLNSSLTYIRSISPSPPDLSDLSGFWCWCKFYKNFIKFLDRKWINEKRSFIISIKLRFKSKSISNFKKVFNFFMFIFIFIFYVFRWTCTVERSQSRSYTSKHTLPPSGEDWVKDANIYQ